MAQIKKLTLKLKSGLLSDLQSDTVMGHFCWRLRDKFGDDKVAEFIKHYQKSELTPIFSITNGLFEKDYWDEKRKKILRTELFFPKPKIHFKNSEATQKEKSKKERMIEFLLNKEFKSLELLTLKQFNLAINGKLEELYDDIISDEIERPKFESDLKVSVEIDRNSLTAKEGQLFSYHPRFLDKDTRVVFLIKIINEKDFEDFKCSDVLKDVFELGFGRKKSSGFGQFEVVLNKDKEVFEDFNRFEIPTNPNSFITLGNYLPSVDDGINPDCNYDFIVKYGRLSEEKSLSDNPFKKPLIMFSPGSVFKKVKIKEYYGKVTQSGDVSEYDLDAVQFGMPFSLNFKTRSTD